MNELQDVKLCSRLKYIVCKQMIYLAIIFIVSKLRYTFIIQSYYEINIGHVLLVYLKSIYTNESNTQALHPLRFQV